MRWLQGWFGTMSGVLGVLLVVILSLSSPIYETCSSVGDGVSCTTASASAQTGALIIVGLLALLYSGALVGTWLDLSGSRRMGRLILLTSDSALMLFTLVLPVALNRSATGTGAALALTYPITLMAFITGILACVRRDTPRPATSTGE